MKKEVTKAHLVNRYLVRGCVRRDDESRLGQLINWLLNHFTEFKIIRIINAYRRKRLPIILDQLLYYEEL